MSVFTPAPSPEDDLLLARVLLRPDASVHIAIANKRSFYATPKGLSSLFSAPHEFLDDCVLYDESTYDINPREVPLSKIAGLELACVWKDKRVQIDFPEIMQYIFRVRPNEKRWSAPLDMSELFGTLEFSDAKSYMLKLYLDFTNHAKAIPAIRNSIEIQESDQMKIIRAIVTTLFDDTLPKAQTAYEITACIEDAVSVQGLQENELVPPELDESYIPMKKYCDMHDVSYNKVYRYKDMFPSLMRSDTGHWFLKKDDIPKVGLRFFKPQPPEEQEDLQTEQQPVIKASYGSQADIKERIIRDGRFNPVMGDYIRTIPELEYYTTSGYKNVRISGRLALVLDIKPDEMIESVGKTNREIIQGGDSPVVPASADYPGEGVFVIHHVGQRRNSPFATVPESIHRTDLYSTFHQGKPDGKLHGKSFDMDRRNFWRSYLELYDKVGYDGFPSAK